MGRMIPNENSWIGFAPSVTVAKLAAPVTSAVTTATTGGTIPRSTTWYYKVTAINANGETTAGTEQSLSTGAGTDTNTLSANWTTVAGATGFKIYRGVAAGQENLLIGTVGLVTTFADTGAGIGSTIAGSTTAVQAAVPPLLNTTGFKQGVANIAAPSLASEIAVAVDLTGFVISITANTTGNTVPTPTLKTKFETSIQGTVGATFSADFYRDDQNDLAWVTLPRGTKGYFIISRFGGSSTTVAGYVAVGDVVEVWPVVVVARSASNLASNTAEVFTLQASVPVQPNESAVVAA
jgi:hypothetical protein